MQELGHKTVHWSPELFLQLLGSAAATPTSLLQTYFNTYVLCFQGMCVGQLSLMQAAVIYCIGQPNDFGRVAQNYMVLKG